MRVRFLGSAAQWGDGGEFHGWQVLAPWHHGLSRFRTPETADEIAAVRRAQLLPRPVGGIGLMSSAGIELAGEVAEVAETSDEALRRWTERYQYLLGPPVTDTPVT